MAKQRIYLDYAATTPVDERVIAAMAPYFRKKFGNPGSLHYFGQEAIALVSKSRKAIASRIGAEAESLIFTGSATEANNLVLRGAAKKFRIKNNTKPKIIVSSIEHKSILETAEYLEKSGEAHAVFIPVDKNGVIDIKKLENEIDSKTAVVSIMYVNNEIGTIEPIQKIGALVEKFRKENGLQNNYPLFHTDAVQAFQFLNCDIKKIKVDMMSISSHKIYGPKGIGALYIKNKELIYPIITGGGQEFGLRSGTENTPNIAGFAKSVELLPEDKNSGGEGIRSLKIYFWEKFKRIYPKARINGFNPKSKNAAPHILNIYIPKYESSYLISKFDIAGISISAGSACEARKPSPSYVIKALGYEELRAKRSIRISFGKYTSKQDIDKIIKITKIII